MKFLVTGQNRDTGARQTLEIAAESRGAAERKATSAGMTVNRVEAVEEDAAEVETAAPTRSSGSKLKWLIIALLLAGLGAAAFLFLRDGSI
jgi:hypothetical protein